MWKYALGRLLRLVPSLLLISVITFALARLLPGDPALAYLGESAPRDQVAYQAVRAELGLDDALPLQYLRWLGKALQGDFGKSVRTHEAVLTGIRQRFPITLELTMAAMLVAALIAIPAGIASAVKPNSWLDNLGTVGAMAGVAIPDFWLGILLIYLLALALHWLPASGFTPPDQSLALNLKMMIMPALALGAAQAGIIMRQVRSSLIEVLNLEYVTTARSKGLSEAAVVRRHALKNGLIPVVTVLGLQTGRLMGGAVIIETIFALPGMGRMTADSIYFRDYSPLQATVLLFGVGVVLINLVADLTYAYLDPRIRYT